MKSVKARQQESGDKVGEFTNELQDITDKLEVIKSTMDERGSSMTDTSPLVRIKKSIETIERGNSRNGITYGCIEPYVDASKDAPSYG